ncbi:PKD domain-containing protein [Flammeovirga kamogawensis]|nr:PKD domain-containing protein [Flammeovirga kamogawensis]
MNFTKTTLLKLFIFTMLGISLSCENKETSLDIPMPVLAKYSFIISDDTVVSFTNKSVGATTYLWDFGDGTTSEEQHVEHVFPEGEFVVNLMAASGAIENTFTKEVNIFVPEIIEPVDVVAEAKKILVGTDGIKKWSIAKESKGYAFGPLDDETIDWFVVDMYDENAFTTRACLFNQEFSFTTEGVYKRVSNGALWKEWQIFENEGCHDTNNDLVTNAGANVEVWEDGEFTYEITEEGGFAVITVTGLGGYVGHYTSGVDASDFLPQKEHKYIIKSALPGRIELSSLGYNGDSKAIPNKADRLVRLILVPSEVTEETVEEEEPIEEVDLSPIKTLLSRSWAIEEKAGAVYYGPLVGDDVWWSLSENDVLARTCLFDSEFTFSEDGSYSRDMNGTIWKEWSIFPDVECDDTSNPLINIDGENVDTWGDGDFTYELSVVDNDTIITVNGMGGYIGHYTSGVDYADYVAHDVHEYKITSISDSELKLSSKGFGGDSKTIAGYDPNKADRIVNISFVPAN